MVESTWNTGAPKTGARLVPTLPKLFATQNPSEIKQPITAHSTSDSQISSSSPSAVSNIDRGGGFLVYAKLLLGQRVVILTNPRFPPLYFYCGASFCLSLTNPTKGVVHDTPVPSALLRVERFLERPFTSGHSA